MLTTVTCLRAMAVVLAVGAAVGFGHAAVVQNVSGVSSAGVPFEFEAEFVISGNALTITLSNISSTHSQNPNDLLSSFYFDIVDGSNVRPTLNYVSATGDTWLTNSSNPDALQQAGASILASNAGDNSWQFRNMNAASAPLLGYGIGTVGNSGLSPNNFNGNIVGGMDFGIYAGDVTTSNLNNRVLVRDSATFQFTGVAGFSEAHISALSAFGLGTAPDSIAYAPAPGAAVLLAIGGIAATRRRR